jgi:photosystem II stability/assembly factor-like uncharacterized protein
VGGLPTKRPAVAFAADPTLWPLMVVALADGVRRSTDGGRTWQRPAGAPSDVTALAVHPEKHQVVFAGTRDGRIIMSADGGVSWQATR